MAYKTRYPCLKLRQQIYYFRISVPKDLRYIFGRSLYKKSLGSGDYKSSVKMSDCYRVFVERYFEELRIMRPTQEDLLALVRNHFEKCLMMAEDDIFLSYEDLRDRVQNEFDYDRKLEVLSSRHSKLMRISQTLQFTDEQENEASELLSWGKFSLDPLSSIYKRFVETLVEAKVEAARLTLAKFKKDTEGLEIRIDYLKGCRNFLINPDPMALEGLYNKPYHSTHSTPAQHQLLISEAIDKYLLFRNEPKEWKNRHRAFLEKLVVIIGPERSIASLTRQDGRDIEKKLWFIPANFKKKFADLPLEEFLAGKHSNYAAISPATAKSYFIAFKTFFAWCYEQEYAKWDVLNKVRLNLPTSHTKKNDPRAFFKNELELLFNSAIFTGRKFRQRNLHVSGPLVIRDGNFWVPVLGVMSGLRLGEILQLTISDIKWDDEVPYIDVNNFGQRTLKNKQSARGIPLHPVLKEIGFLDYVEQRKKEEGDPEKRLIDGIVFPEKGKLIKNFSRSFSSYLTAIGLKKSREVVFHSLRHNYVIAMRRACKDNPDIMSALDGRKEIERSRGTRAGYGFDLTPKELYPHVSLMDFGISFEHLYPAKSRRKLNLQD